MSKVTEYEKISFSAFEQELYDRVKSEANNQDKKVILTGRTGTFPADITPEMRTWYEEYVHSTRKSALDEVDTQLKGIVRSDQAGAALLERRIGQINEETIIQKQEFKSQHTVKNGMDYDSLKTYKLDYLAASRRFDVLKREYGGRDPKLLGPVYWLCLIFIGIFEAFINFEAFSKLSFMTPFTALGSTVIIAVLLAASSHLIGATFKQFQAYFSDSSGSDNTRQGIFMLAKGALGIGVVLAAVWYARANFLADAILERSIIGGQAPTWLATVGGSLILNVGVWLIGVIFSFLWHDPDPDFPDSFTSREKHKKKYETLRKRLDKPINKKFKEIDAKSEKARERARQLDNSMHDKPEYQIAREKFEVIKVKDNKVISALQKSKAVFCKAIAKQDTYTIEKPLDFEHDDYRGNKRETSSIDCAEFMSLEITLKYT